MRKSTRALVGLLVMDLLLLAGIAWLVLQITSGAWTTTVPPGEAIRTITSIGGGAIGVITAVLGMVFVVRRRKGD